MKIKNLSRLQKKVLDACMDGWFMSGEYTAMFDNHRRSFEADSPLWLYRDMEAMPPTTGIPTCSSSAPGSIRGNTPRHPGAVRENDKVHVGKRDPTGSFLLVFGE